MNSSTQPFRLGLVVNPYAGVGGPAARKGSDEQAVQLAAREGRLALTAPARTITFLQTLLASIPANVALTVVTIPGLMGATCGRELGIALEVLPCAPAEPYSTGEDTREAAKAIAFAGVDLLVFVGGDGTARDVCAAVGTSQLVLGVPAGVKMHSSVYAVNPQMAATVVCELMAAQLVGVVQQEVRDIDEQAFREGVVKSRFYGEMLVPQGGQLIQSVKHGGFEVEELVLLDIAEHLRRHAQPQTLFIMGPGSTTLNIQKNWGLSGTLLGVDLVIEDRLLEADVDAPTINARVAEHNGPVLLVVTAIGGQGHVIGRGNQQISAQVLRQLGRKNLRVVATRSKLKSFSQRPLVMDSGDADLDREWQGYIPVITGFDDVVFYPLGFFGSA